MTSLHIPKLDILNFRGLKSLQLSNLGQVTLLIGENKIGKTTVLEAIQFFISRGDRVVIDRLLIDRRELIYGTDMEGSEIIYPDLSALFYESLSKDNKSSYPKIVIDAGRKKDKIFAEITNAEDDIPNDLLLVSNNNIKAIEIRCGTRKRQIAMGRIKNKKPIFSEVPIGYRKNDSWPEEIPHQLITPSVLDFEIASRLWNDVVFTPKEEFVKDTLRLVLGEELEGISTKWADSNDIMGLGYRYIPQSRKANSFIVKLKNLEHPIPLNRLGDGAQHLLGISLGLANSENGILLIDEIENGMHYSLQYDLWKMLFGAAKLGNVQIVAATHSWDCIAGFAKVAKESDEEGALIRIERYGDEIEAVHYSEQELVTIAEQRIEVR